MVNSPISIPLPLSQSRKPGDLVRAQAVAADALKIERYINARMETEHVREFAFAMLAAELSMDQERVCGLLGKLAGHENAITVCNPQKRPKTPAIGRATSGGSSRSNGGVPAGPERSSIATAASV